MTQISSFTGEFTDASREAAFQEERLPESRRHARLLFLLSAILNGLFLLSDWRFAGTPHFWIAVPARIAVVLWSLYCLSLTGRMTSFRRVERICCAWQLVTAIGVAFLVSSRSDIAIFVLVMLPLVFYLVVPTSFRGNVGGGLGCGALLLLGYMAPAPLSATMPGMVMAVLVLHCGMWMAIARNNRLQRTEWTSGRLAREAQAALADSRDTLERMFMAVPVPLLVTRKDGRVVRQNRAAAEAYAAGGDAVLNNVDAAYVDSDARERFFDRLTRGETIEGFECQIQRGDGETRSVLMSARSVSIEGEACVMTSVIDITGRKEDERRLHRLAMSDSLTGLANRAHFMAELTRATQRPAEKSRRFAVLLIDLDEFKRVNDTAGHDAGDALLCAVAQRLGEVVGPNDLAARMGGDEFALLLGAAPDDGALARTLAHISDLLHAPLHHHGRSIESRASIGVAISPDHGDDATTLMKHADIALYDAKNNGRGRATLFSEALLDHWNREAAMLDRARRVVAHEGPRPWYQPKVAMADGALVGFEALFRCPMADGSVVMPADIAVAFEHAELGPAITRLMVRGIIDDCRAWAEMGLAFGHVAVNVSGADLLDDGFPGWLVDQMRGAGLPPACLELEVTESVFLGRDVDRVGRALHRLSEAGFTIALDDFGTGYASLSHLKQFPIDVIKIDRQFVRDLHTDPDDAAIVRAVLTLAYSLGVRTVAEGVETMEQLDYLRAGGCHVGQGYHFGHAVPADAAKALLRCHETATHA